jgi:hypothetical protein
MRCALERSAPLFGKLGASYAPAEVQRIDDLTHVLGAVPRDHRVDIRHRRLRCSTAKAGLDGVMEMLAMITTQSASKVRALRERARDAGSSKVLVLYGGAMHNDAQPRAGWEKYSYAKELSALPDAKYIELDLFVPEFMKDEPPWTTLPWFTRFDRKAHDDKVRLMEPTPGSFVLVFAKSDR